MTNKFEERKKILWQEYEAEDIEVDIYEDDVDNYWKATAANAMRPLYKLIELAKMRPDGIWDGD